MVELGYVEGETIVYESVTFDPDQTEQLLTAAQDMVNQPVDLILGVGTQGALTAQQVTQNNDIPVIFAGINDPVGIGLVDTFR